MSPRSEAAKSHDEFALKNDQLGSWGRSPQCSFSVLNHNWRNVRTGSKASLCLSASHFRSSPMNGHRKSDPGGPVRAHKRTHAPLQISVLFDHLVGDRNGDVADRALIEASFTSTAMSVILAARDPFSAC